MCGVCLKGTCNLFHSLSSTNTVYDQMKRERENEWAKNKKKIHTIRRSQLSSPKISTWELYDTHLLNERESESNRDAVTHTRFMNSGKCVERHTVVRSPKNINKIALLESDKCTVCFTFFSLSLVCVFVYSLICSICAYFLFSWFIDSTTI